MLQSTGGVWPLSPHLLVSMTVDDELIERMRSADLDPINELHHQARGALRYQAESLAVDVSEGCVLVRHAGEGGSMFTQRYEARWAPWRGAKAEFRGGHIDGQLMDVRRDEAGWPEPVIRIPAPVGAFAAFQAEDDYPSRSFPIHPVYQLAGFRNDPAVWVYDLQDD